MHLDFDRGTLLLTPNAHSSITPEGLPGVLFDDRVSRWRAPAYLRRKILRELRAHGQRPTGPAAQRPEPLPGRWAESFGLRGYQRGALLSWQCATYAGVLVLPTGSGKTRTACAAIASAGLPTLVLVPTRVLLHQWASELSRWYTGEVARWGDGDQGLAPVTVATYASMRRHMERIGDRFGMLVVDEVHHFGSEGRSEILEMCVAGVRLGLTATMPHDPGPLAVIAERVGPVVFEQSVADLAGTALAPFDRIVLTTRLGPEEAEAYRRDYARFREVHSVFRRTYPGARWQDFLRVARRTDAGQAALRAWDRCRTSVGFPEGKRRLLAELLRRHRGDRVLVFAPNNRAVYRIAREHLIAPVTCDIGRREREELLARFQSGRLHALVSAQVLNEGIDVPGAEVAVVVGGRGGRLEHVQRIGRVLRPAPGKRAVVYELVVEDTAETWQALRRSEGLGLA